MKPPLTVLQTLVKARMGALKDEEARLKAKKEAAAKAKAKAKATSTDYMANLVNILFILIPFYWILPPTKLFVTSQIVLLIMALQAENIFGFILACFSLFL
jgi:hypothetical protein